MQLHLTKEDLLPYIILSPILSAFLFLLPLEIGYDITVGCCIISCLTSLLFYRNQIGWNGYKTIVACYLVFALCSKLWDIDGYSTKEVRTLAYVSLFILTVPAVSIHYNRLKPILMLSSMLILSQTLYQFHVLGLPRVHGYMNPIPYATVVATLSAFLLILLVTETQNYKRLLFTLLFSTSILSVIYTGSRGVWFALALSIPVVLFFGFTLIKKNRSKAFICAVILGSCTALFLASPILIKRYKTFSSSYKQLLNGNYVTSLGARLQLWKAAVYTIKRDGLLGAELPYEENLKQLKKEGILDKNVHKKKYIHYHNTFLDRLAKYGIQGLILTLLLLFFPLYIFFKQRNTNKILFLMTIPSASIYAFAGITDMPLLNKESLLFFIIISYLPFILTTKMQNKTKPLHSN